MSLEEEIRKNSDGLLRHCEIICLKSTESTNKYLKELALKRQSEAAFEAYEAQGPAGNGSAPGPACGSSHTQGCGSDFAQGLGSAFAANGALQPVLVVAEAQSEGRGRLGRSFYSPSGSGIYFSILLRPASPCEAGEAGAGASGVASGGAGGVASGRAIGGAFSESGAAHAGTLSAPAAPAAPSAPAVPSAPAAFDFPALTAAAALSVCEAVFKLTDGKKQPKIKWVNDILCGGRKICGILSEGLSDAESGRLIACVLGIGINLYEPQGGFSGMGLKEAGAIFEGGSFPSEKDEELKGRLIAEILKRLFYYYGLSDKGELREKYRALSIAVGRKVRVLKNGGEREALAEYIDDGFGLTVSYEDGSRERLFSGEISLRL